MNKNRVALLWLSPILLALCILSAILSDTLGASYSFTGFIMGVISFASGVGSGVSLILAITAKDEDLPKFLN